MGGYNYKLLSKKLEISPKAVERLLGSIKIDLNETSYEIGLRLEKKDLETDLHPVGLSDEQLVEACKRYEQACPAVYHWICSGDFRPDSKSANVLPAVIIHACRNAGRLRAELIRD